MSNKLVFLLTFNGTITHTYWRFLSSPSSKLTHVLSLITVYVYVCYVVVVPSIGSLSPYMCQYKSCNHGERYWLSDLIWQVFLHTLMSGTEFKKTVLDLMGTFTWHLRVPRPCWFYKCDRVIVYNCICWCLLI